MKKDKADVIFDLRAEANKYFWEKYESILNAWKWKKPLLSKGFR
ncbi:hypothetical protein V7654_10355 [Bacillus sp. JJ1609]